MGCSTFMTRLTSLIFILCSTVSIAQLDTFRIISQPDYEGLNKEEITFKRSYHQINGWAKPGTPPAFYTPRPKDHLDHNHLYLNLNLFSYGISYEHTLNHKIGLDFEMDFTTAFGRNPGNLVRKINGQQGFRGKIGIKLYRKRGINLGLGIIGQYISWNNWFEPLDPIGYNWTGFDYKIGPELALGRTIGRGHEFGVAFGPRIYFSNHTEEFRYQSSGKFKHITPTYWKMEVRSFFRFNTRQAKDWTKKLLKSE